MTPNPFESAIETVSFYCQFPDEELELQLLDVRNHPVIADGIYLFSEQYCINPECDCRRAYVYIVHGQTEKIIATLTYAWEPATFYRQWMRHVSGFEMSGKHFTGARVTSMKCAAKAAKAFLTIFKSLLRNP